VFAGFFADLHVHIGRTKEGFPVKVTAACSQTLRRVMEEAVSRKGLDFIGIVDAACPRICRELEELVVEGELRELPGGGLRWRESLTVIPGAEVEATEESGCSAHWLGYFPGLKELSSFSEFLAERVANPELSTQCCRLPARVLLSEVLARSGVFLPAHAFTPHKGVYGQCTARLESLLGKKCFQKISALELGLSADTALADRLEELGGITYLSNSDAHSLKNLGREYNLLLIEEPDWSELNKALQGRDGRRIAANYGLDPRLGKYHRTFCLSCGRIAGEPHPVTACSACGSSRVVKGVLDRIWEIQDRETPLHPPMRPPYYHQVPLLFLPGVGPKTVSRLLERFGTEIDVLHRVTFEELVEAVGKRTATIIQQARLGKLAIAAGGGGIYGKVSLARSEEGEGRI
jgi:uncharacterized protein (TIGR00375 family)